MLRTHRPAHSSSMYLRPSGGVLSTPIGVFILSSRRSQVTSVRTGSFAKLSQSFISGAADGFSSVSNILHGVLAASSQSQTSRWRQDHLPLPGRSCSCPLHAERGYFTPGAYQFPRQSRVTDAR